jgi:hypothetical protein
MKKVNSTNSYKSDFPTTLEGPTIQMKSEENNNFIQKELQHMTTSLNKTVYELSKEHRVVCLFIKWFGCPM